MPNVSISICPTSLQFAGGDTYDEDALLDAIREYVGENLPGARITCLQVGHRQGDEWATVDGDDDAGHRLLEQFFLDRGCDPDLYIPETIR